MWLARPRRYMHTERLACPSRCSNTVETYTYGITHSDARPRGPPPPCAACGSVLQRTSGYDERPMLRATLLDLSPPADRPAFVARTHHLVVRGDLCRKIRLGQRIRGSGYLYPLPGRRAGKDSDTCQIDVFLLAADTPETAARDAAVAPDVMELCQSPWHLSAYACAHPASG